MPKRKAKNPFFFFMLDWKKRAEAKGQTFPNGLKDVQANHACSEEWKSLSKEQKAEFGAMAKADKINSQLNKDKKIDEELIAKKNKDAFIQEMYQFLENIISRAYPEDLQEMQFCFIHANYFFMKQTECDVEYFPAEFAIGSFCIENGITDVYHEIISTKIPLGFKREALEVSYATHKIPLESSYGEDDFAKIYEKLVNFVNPKKLEHEYPIIFTTKSVKKIVHSLITQLSEAGGEDNQELIILDLETLFIYMSKAIYKDKTDTPVNISAVAEYLFSRSTVSFKNGNECPFHKYIDSGYEYCSKSMLQQWMFAISKELCAPFNVEMMPGVHFIVPKQENKLCLLKKHFDSLDLNTKDKYENPDKVLSMTGVGDEHSARVSERTYNEELERRRKCKPVQVIEHSELNPPTSPVDEAAEQLIPDYLSAEPNPGPSSLTEEEEYMRRMEYNFPPIGGRNVMGKPQFCKGTKKRPLGKGKKHA